jgi:uncharacterized FlaG/YvyC family protein
VQTDQEDVMRSDSAMPVSDSLPTRPTAQTKDTNAVSASSIDSAPQAEFERERKLAEAPLLAEEVRIALDEEARRYVRQVIDPETNQVVRSYPAEGQLAFARAISAYLKAQVEALD